MLKKHVFIVQFPVWSGRLVSFVPARSPPWWPTAMTEDQPSPAVSRAVESVIEPSLSDSFLMSSSEMKRKNSQSKTQGIFEVLGETSVNGNVESEC